MKLARIAHSGGVSFAVIEGIAESDDISGAIVREIAQHPFGEPTFTDRQWPLADVRLLAPILATKLISVTGAKDGIPRFVIKPNTSIVGPNAIIVCPEDAHELYAGPTIAVVIGKPSRKLSIAEVPEAILGYTLASDITALDIASIDGDFTRAKSYDGFCPLGPWIDTDYLVENVKIDQIYDGVFSQTITYDDFPLAVFELVSELSHIMTLLPGDTILLGTRYTGIPITTSGIGQITAPGFAPLKIQVRFERE